MRAVSTQAPQKVYFFCGALLFLTLSYLWMSISHFNLSIGSRLHQQPAKTRMTLAKAVAVLKEMKYSPDIEQLIIKELSSCPEGTYVAYLKEVPRRARDIAKNLK